MYKGCPYTLNQISNLLDKQRLRPFTKPAVFTYSLYMGKGLSLVYNSYYKDAHLLNKKMEFFLMGSFDSLQSFKEYALKLMNNEVDDFNYLDYV